MVWLIIKRMKAGWGAEGANSSSSGGTLESYLKEAIDGTIVYDGSESEYGAVVGLVISGPILKATLYGVKRFDTRAGARMLPGLEGGFAGVTALAIAQKGKREYTSLDYVGWNIYRPMLEAIGGVKFGVVRSGKVVWE